jgi:hypothetical protein
MTTDFEQSRRDEAERARAQAEAPEAVASATTIQTTAGILQVRMERFPALEGYEISRAYRNYVSSKDPDFRRAFVLGVLQYATVDDISLVSVEVINIKLETWRNVEKVFYAVLTGNDIDIELEEEKTNYWAIAGADLAASFIAASAKLMLPLMQAMEDDRKEAEAETEAEKDA